MTNLNTPVVAKLNMVEAVNAALDWELAHDPSVVLLGEDIGITAACFAPRWVKGKYGFNASWIRHWPKH